jgi:hypothetical protein
MNYLTRSNGGMSGIERQVAMRHEPRLTGKRDRRIERAAHPNQQGSLMLMDLDVVMLSRIQFAVTIMFHYLFPPLSIGLGVILVIMEGMYLKTGNPVYESMTRFWVKIFGLVFAIGVASGIVMEFHSAPTGRTTRASSATCSARPGRRGSFCLLSGVGFPGHPAVRVGQGQ